MRSSEKIQGALRKFAADWRDFPGSERSEAQTYLNELIGCYGAGRRSAAAWFEGSHTAHGIMDMYWPGVCIVEMKAPGQADKLPDHRKQALEYWHSSDDPRFVVLCAFQRFEVWERERLPLGPHADFTLAELPDNYEKLIFLAGTDQASRKSLFLKWAAVVVAACVCAVGILLLWGVWRGKPVAAAFTRVGGATRVDTAVAASRFWLTPPRCVVMTRPFAGQDTMFAAARYAMNHDAPLLFIPKNPKQMRLVVGATITGWQKDAAARHQMQPDMVTFKSSHDKSGSCQAKANTADVGGLSTLKVPNQPLQPPLGANAPRDALAPIVVFAAAWGPRDPPDVAVGMALAAHMATTAAHMAATGPEVSFAVPRYLMPTTAAHMATTGPAAHKAATAPEVSLVVVPRYLEADPSLENQLQEQSEPVKGGIVLGSTKIIPDDTRALLRQLLTSTGRQGLFAQLQANLGSVGSLIAALLALVGLGTAARVAGPMVIERLERTEQIKRIERLGDKVIFRRKPEPPEPEAGTDRESEIRKSDWITALGESQEVTITLRSGRQVTGTLDSQTPANFPDATIFRINTAPFVRNVADSTGIVVSPSRREKKYVLVSIKEIELIHINDSESGGREGSSDTS